MLFLQTLPTKKFLRIETFIPENVSHSTENFDFESLLLGFHMYWNLSVLITPSRIDRMANFCTLHLPHVVDVHVCGANSELANVLIKRISLKPHWTQEGDLSELIVEHISAIYDPHTSQAVQNLSAVEAFQIVNEDVGCPQVIQELQ